MKPLLNGALFQLNWFICIFTNNSLAIASTFVFLVIHARYFVQFSKEWFYIVIFTCLGFSFDLLLCKLNLLTFQVFPFWLFCLWLSFATCLFHALGFFYQKIGLLAVIIMLAIPFNYYLGAKLTSTSITLPELTLFLITLYWLLVLPIFIRMITSYRNANENN